MGTESTNEDRAHTPVAATSPLRVAWTAYQATDDYANTKRWATHEAHVEGSLWAAFLAGFLAAGGQP